MVNENEVKKALNLSGDFMNGIYEEKHGKFVIDLTDLKIFKVWQKATIWEY